MDKCGLNKSRLVETLSKKGTRERIDFESRENYKTHSRSIFPRVFRKIHNETIIILLLYIEVLQRSTVKVKKGHSSRTRTSLVGKLQHTFARFIEILSEQILGAIVKIESTSRGMRVRRVAKR